MSVQWQKYTTTGFEQMDREHLELETLMAHLAEGVSANDLEEVASTLVALLDLSAAHFRNEERLMRDACWPLFRPHRDLHREFLIDGARTAKELGDNGLTLRFRQWAVNRLPGWFRSHIATNDISLGRFLVRLERARLEVVRSL